MAVELLGALTALAGLVVCFAQRSPRSGAWSAVVGLLVVSAVVHLLESLEWWGGFDELARLGEMLAVLVPAMWGFVLLSLRQARAEREMRALQERVEHQNRTDLAELMAGSIAHDVRNMLHAMRMQADLIETGTLDDRSLRAATATLHEAIGISTRLLNDLTGLHRREVAEQRELDLCELVRSFERLLAGCVPSSMALRVTIEAPGPVWVHAAPIQLQQAMLNLVVNARDAMPHGGQIEVRVEQTPQAVWLSVTDEGEGISPDVRSRIFEPLFTTKQAQQGSGLGLSIVQRIAERHRGAVVVEDASPRGTRVALRLPRGERDAAGQERDLKASGTITTRRSGRAEAR